MRSWNRLFLLASLAGSTAGCGDDSPGTPIDVDAGDAGVEGNAADGSTGGSSGSSTGGRGGRSTGGGANAGGSGAKTTCDDLECDAPATCDDTGEEAKCVCPEGYDDVNDDGSECEDIDECDEETDDCPNDSACENTEGSFECDCNEEGLIEVDGECLKDNAEDCDEDDECASGYCVGGVCCGDACDSPGPCSKLEGTVCVNGDECRYGKAEDETECDDGNACTTSTCFDGECLPEDVKECDDDNACTEDSCDEETGECKNELTCDDNNPCTNDTCDEAVGCGHTNNNAANCTDDDPCTIDVCRAGVCEGTEMDCSELTDDCNEGVCVDGSCEPQPANEDGACTTDLAACDSAGSCNAQGACEGDGDACGDLASSCESCSGGGDCFQGRRCSCETPGQNDPAIKVVAGVCVEDTNECNADPCDDIATSCNDPTPNGSKMGDVKCTCPKGYGGDGIGPDGCQDVDECDGKNPCGEYVAPGGCNGLSPAGSYSCTCKEGFRQIRTAAGATCVCDLTGTFELITETTLSWDDVDNVENPPNGGLQSKSWSLRYQTMNANGTLTVTTIPCGGEVAETCASIPQLPAPFPPDGNAAVAPYQANQVWGKPGMRATSPTSGVPVFTLNAQGVLPGANASYVEPETAVLSGISLADRNGAWPPCRQCVNVPAGQSTCTCSDGSTHNITNRATWVNSDGIDQQGITTFFIPAGGRAIGATAFDPPYDFGADSVCPRLSSGTWPYTSAPGATGVCAFLADKTYGATRTMSQLKSTTVRLDTETNSCSISGNVTGPGPGQRPRLESRTFGCNRAAQGGFCANATGPCTTQQINSIDAGDQSVFQITAATFELKNITGEIDIASVMSMPNGPAKDNALSQACADLRVRNCPAGKDCGG